MEPIRVPVTLSPHVVNGKPRGYYLLVRKLFLHDTPKIRKQQFIAVGNCLRYTFGTPPQWDTLVKMGVYCQTLDENPVSWISEAKVWPLKGGFKGYIPGTILKPSAESIKWSGMGVVKAQAYGGVSPVYYVELPGISAEVLLGREKI